MNKSCKDAGDELVRLHKHEAIRDEARAEIESARSVEISLADRAKTGSSVKRQERTAIGVFFATDDEIVRAATISCISDFLDFVFIPVPGRVRVSYA